jgi:hypothetical protein
MIPGPHLIRAQLRELALRGIVACLALSVLRWSGSVPQNSVVSYGAFVTLGAAVVDASAFGVSSFEA